MLTNILTVALPEIIILISAMSVLLLEFFSKIKMLHLYLELHS